jgi:adenine-specific DNA-methyltransferase
LGHPLAQKIIEKCKAFTTDSQTLTFDYSHSGKRISILEPLVGKSGFIRIICDTVTALETEDFVLLSGVCDDGTPVDAEQCRRFFSLGATEKPTGSSSLPGHLQPQLDESLQRQQNEVLTKLTERNAAFFEIELDKLDRWSDDLKVGLEQELKELDRQIREARRSAQISAALAEKLSIQKQIRELEANRNRKRRELFDAQDRIDEQRQDLIETIEKKLQQECQVNPVFTLRWSLI